MQYSSLDDEFDWVANEFSKQTGHKIVKFLGSGEHGNAYLTDDDKVIKITSDKSEFFESKKLMGKDPVHLPKIYDCYTVESKKLISPIWVILLEYVEHGRKDQEYLWYTLSDAFEEQLGLDLMDELSSLQVNHNTVDYMVDLLNHLDIPEDVLEYYDQLISMIEELKKYGVTSIDYGPQNLGFRDHILVFFDLGFGEENDTGGGHKTIKI